MLAEHDNNAVNINPLTRTIRFSFLYFACFTASCAYGFIYLLPLLITSFGGGAAQVGIFLSIAGLVTVLLVGFCGNLANKIGSPMVCIMGTALTGVGFIILHLANSINLFFYTAAIFIGLGWSFYYAASPMILNRAVTDKERGKYLSNIAAFVVLGTGTGPALGGLLHKHFSMSAIYLLPIAISAISALLFWFQRSWWHNTSTVIITKTSISPKQFNLLRILNSEAKYPLIMVFLGACIFSSMMNFQTLYANTKSLNFSVYYIGYMLSVVLSRFLFGGILSKKNPLTATPYLLMLMSAGLILMLLNPHNTIIYSISAIALGVSYGLVYPLIKTYAVNVTEPALRSHVIAYFTQSYFIGVYFFPLIGGFTIQYLNQNIFLILLISICVIDGLIAFSRIKK